MHRMGWAIDWGREVSTHDPAYYRWTQWLFLRFYERGLAYRKEAPVKWCPNDQTVLANEQVVDGRCERCGAEVEAKSLTQWFFKITDYADELLDEMALLEDWPERVLTMQRNWIGRSQGARVVFGVEGSGEQLPVFTTRPDTLFGATFFVLAPENPLVPQLVAGSEHEPEVLEYVRRTAARVRGRARGEGEGRRLHGPVRGQSRQRRVDPDLGGRLRPDGIRHGGDHGRARARRARLRVRGAVRDRDPARGRTRGRGASRGTASPPTRRARCWSTRASSTGCRVLKQGADRRLARRAAASAKRRSATGCATGSSRGSATGAVRSRSSTARPAARSPVPDDQLPVAAAGRRGLPPEGGRRSRRAEDWVATPALRCGGAGEARDGHDGHVRRLVLVLHPLHRPARTRSCRSTARSPTTGCRSTSTSAASSTPCCTCSTRGSSRR